MQSRHFGFRIYRGMDAAIGKPCPYCRETMLQEQLGRRPSRDHILPRSKGGVLRKNKLICCEACNRDKDDKTLWQWQRALKKRGDKRARFVLEVIVSLYPFLGDRAYRRVVGRECDGAWFP